MARYIWYINNTQDKSSIHIIDGAPDGASIMVSQMKEKLQKLENLDLVIIDYLELIQPESKEKRWLAQLFDIGIGLHNLSRELNIPILLLCQLPKSIEYRTDKRPIMQDFRNYPGIEQHADIVMLLYRDSYPKFYEPSHYHFDPIIECNIAKNRYGETETILLNCQLDFKVL